MTKEFNPVYLKIKELASKQKISLTQLEKTLGLSHGIISNWKRSNPTADKLDKIATYFHVSTDYLLNRKNILTNYEEQIIKQFREETKGMDEKEKAEFAYKVVQMISFVYAISPDGLQNVEISYEDSEPDDKKK